MWKALEIYLGENPNADKVEFQDDSDGKGPYIAKWEYDMPKPTIEQLEALSDKVDLVLAQEKIIAQGNKTMQKVFNEGTYDVFGWDIAKLSKQAEINIQNILNGVV